MEKTEMMKHTKEPWVAKKTLQGRDSSISNRRGKTIAIAYRNENIDGDDLANAQRIVACVNACAGIRTEALESGLIKHLLNDAYMRTLNPLDPNPQDKMDMKYLGKPVYEEDFEEV